MRKLITASDDQCVHELQHNYSLCSSFTQCEDCVSNSSCGYESQSGRCLAGGAMGPSCSSFNIQWKYGGGCTGGPTSGHMVNVAPEHKGMIYPEIRNKLGATGPVWKELDAAGKVRVVSGNFSNLSSESSMFINPSIRSSITSTEVPNSWDPKVDDGISLVSGKVSNLAPNAQGLISPLPPNVYNRGLVRPEQTHVETLNPSYIQEDEKVI